jgi:LPXTG-site transpeptidase (sortase) family protein
MRKQKILAISITLIMLLAMAGTSFNVSAATAHPPLLGVLLNYSVLAHTGVTNSGPTSMPGNIGSDLSTIGLGITVGPPGTTVTAAEALIAQNAAVVAAVSGANSLEHQGPGTTLDNSELAGRTLTSGVYTVPGTALLSGSVLGGILTLNGPGVYIFLTDGLTASGHVHLEGGADPCSVFWRDASSVSISNPGTGDPFVGTIIALTSITMNTGATLNGRAIAQTGDVTLLSNPITAPTCTMTTTTTLSAASVTTGTSVYDTASLSGSYTSTSIDTVTYNVYSDPACSSLTTTAGTKTVASGSLPHSNPITLPIGTYYWQAVYNGDSFNSNSVCGDERLRVSAAAPAATSTPAGGVLPGTGFAPQRATLLSVQPAAQSYADLGDLWLEIPRLGVQMPIVGVPQANGQWDVSWLGNDAGWLNGTAFPTYSGNSVLAGHVYNADGTPGPFVHLNGLWWGDQVIVHAWGAQYVYEVRTVMQVTPFATSSVITHKDLPWVTLVTCRGYDEASNSYEYRVAVGAVLVEVK